MSPQHRRAQWVRCLLAAGLLFTGSESAFAQNAPRPNPPSSGAGAHNPPPAQAARVDLIARGAQLFDDQQYEESIQTLSAALVRPNNTREQKIEIYRFLALNYITLNRKDEAESAVRGLLSIEPMYELPKNESPRFRDFFAAVRHKWESEGRPGLVKETVPTPHPVTLMHTSPAQADANQSIALNARIDDPDHRVSEVRLAYRSGSKGVFAEVVAGYSNGSARVTIPGSQVAPPFVEYYFLAIDKNGSAVGSRGDASAPLRIAVPEPSKGWVLPVAIGGGILGAAAIVGGLALAGVFKSSPPQGRSTVLVTVTE